MEAPLRTNALFQVVSLILILEGASQLTSTCLALISDASSRGSVVPDSPKFKEEARLCYQIQREFSLAS